MSSEPSGGWPAGLGGLPGDDDAPTADPGEVGRRIFAFAQEAFPICRSITGDGVRQTLELLRRIVPALEIREVPTGKAVLDWTVPEEWNVREAWIAGPDGRRVVDFAEHNLHLMGYSEPVDTVLELDALQEHLFSLPERPDAIPYRTSYWKRHWAFCLRHADRERLGRGSYRVHIDASLEPGHLTYGEVALPATGERGPAGEGTVLVTAHVCHPSLANDNLSGLGVVAHLARVIAALPERRYAYRFTFVPGTIGAITWLAENRDVARRITHGLVASNLGDGGAFHFKRSRRGKTELDRAVETVLRDGAGEEGEARPYEVEDFVPFGYDERQYCSPGFDLAVGLLSRSPWGRFPEYHTSDDDLSLIDAEHLGESWRCYLEVLHLLETNRTFRNRAPEGEPQLGRRGLYHHIGGGEEGRERQLALLWVLNQSDGTASLLDIAERSGMAYARILDAARALEQAELLEPVSSRDPDGP